MKILKIILFSLLAILSLVGVYSIYNYWGSQKTKKEVTATVLLERVDKVMKLVSVEGGFSEIYDYKHHYFADIWPFRKKALVRVNAKVFLGYDLEKAQIETDEEERIITINNLPWPEIMSIEHDLEYYNFENGLFNIISNKDITEMGFEAKEFIAEKAKESDLFTQAEEQCNELLDVLGLAMEASGWKLVINRAPRLAG